MELFTEVINLYIERKDWFLELIGQHIGIAAVSILLAGIIGLLAGIWIAEHDRFAAGVLTVANVFYTIPSISLLGMLIPFIGIGDKTAVLALTIYGIMPIIRNTYAGIRGVSEDVIMAARGMGSTNLQIMMKIKLPLALGLIACGKEASEEAAVGSSQAEEVTTQETGETEVAEAGKAAAADRAIRIATKPMTEQYILSEMLKLVQRI